MIEFTEIYFWIFGALTIAGGIMGYVSKRSMASLAAGAICGGLLVYAASRIHPPQLPNESLFIGLVVSVVLAGRFIPNYIEKKAPIPGGLMALLSSVSVVVTLLAWHARGNM